MNRSLVLRSPGRTTSGLEKNLLASTLPLWATTWAKSTNFIVGAFTNTVWFFSEDVDKFHNKRKSPFTVRPNGLLTNRTVLALGQCNHLFLVDFEILAAFSWCIINAAVDLNNLASIPLNNRSLKLPMCEHNFICALILPVSSEHLSCISCLLKNGISKGEWESEGMGNPNI